MMSKKSSWGFGLYILIALIITGIDSFTTKKEYQIEAWLTIAAIVALVYLVKFIRYIIRENRKEDNSNNPVDTRFARFKRNLGSQRNRGNRTNSRIEAIRAMGEEKKSGNIKPLLNELTNSTPGIAEAAYRTLMGIRFPQAVEPLMEALDSPDALVVNTAMSVLGQIGDVRALPQLLKMGDKTNFVDSLVLKQAGPSYVELDNAIGKIREKKCYHGL